MNELRTTARVRSFLRGEINHSNGASKTECTIRDISEGGARIQIPGSITIPDHFELIIPQKGTTERAKTIWRHGNEIGVIFVNHKNEPIKHPASSSTEIDYRIEELERESARMRVQIAQMRAMLDQILNPSS